MRYTYNRILPNANETRAHMPDPSAVEQERVNRAVNTVLTAIDRAAGRGEDSYEISIAGNLLEAGVLRQLSTDLDLNGYTTSFENNGALATLKVSWKSTQP